MRLLRRRQPTARELIAAALTRRDYRAAAVLIAAGALAVLDGAAAETHEATTSDRTLSLAIAKVTANR